MPFSRIANSDLVAALTSALDRFCEYRRIHNENERRYYAGMAVAAMRRGANDADDILDDLNIAAFFYPYPTHH